jgi:hypothetical protein
MILRNLRRRAGTDIWLADGSDGHTYAIPKLVMFTSHYAEWHDPGAGRRAFDEDGLEGLGFRRLRRQEAT